MVDVPKWFHQWVKVLCTLYRVVDYLSILTISLSLFNMDAQSVTPIRTSDIHPFFQEVHPIPLHLADELSRPKMPCLWDQSSVINTLTSRKIEQKKRKVNLQLYKGLFLHGKILFGKYFYAGTAFTPLLPYPYVLRAEEEVGRKVIGGPRLLGWGSSATLRLVCTY